MYRCERTCEDTLVEENPSGYLQMHSKNLSIILLNRHGQALKSSEGTTQYRVRRLKVLNPLI